MNVSNTKKTIIIGSSAAGAAAIGVGIGAYNAPSSLKPTYVKKILDNPKTGKAFLRYVEKKSGIVAVDKFETALSHYRHTEDHVSDAVRYLFRVSGASLDEKSRIKGAELKKLPIEPEYEKILVSLKDKKSYSVENIHDLLSKGDKVAAESKKTIIKAIKALGPKNRVKGAKIGAAAGLGTFALVLAGLFFKDKPKTEQKVMPEVRSEVEETV